MELIAPIRVVVIDDKPTHLFSIANGLTLAGIPCAWHWYDTKTNKLTPPPPEGGYKHLRLLFTDLNIQNVPGTRPDPSTLASILISDVLQPVISPQGGPYSIVLWTNVSNNAQLVEPIITERINLGDDKRPQPLAISILSKQSFIPPHNEDVENSLSTLLEQMAGSSTELRSQVAQAASKDKQLRLACAWESRASMAAAKTIGSVYRAAVAEGAQAGIAPTIAFQKVLGKIAVEALGERNAKEEPTRALDDGLIDIFVDDMRSSENEDEYLHVVHDALDEVLQNRPDKLSPTARNILNTFLQIEHLKKPVARIPRGAVMAIRDDDIREWCGTSKKDLIWQEFLVPMNQLKAELERMKEEKYPDDMLAEFEQQLNFLCNNKDKLEQNTRVVALEIGADCDHAQRKQRTVRLLWALEIPSEFEVFISPRGELKHDALIQFGPWAIDDQEKALLVSIRRFGIQQSWERKGHMDARYRLRKPLVDYVLHRYSSHSNRPGIMTITG